MNFLIKITTKLNNYFKKKKFNFKSKKISNLFRELSNFDKVQIYDFGAGLRYLPTLLKFDGISKIHLIDPNDNLDISYRNLKKLFTNKKFINKYKVAISDKNEKIFYYPAKRSTGSSFVKLKKKKSYDDNYFGNIKKILKQVYEFETFKKKYNLKTPDIIKIDVEGFEFKILKSILRKNKPFIIEVEVNFDNSLTDDTFLKIHSILKKNNYDLNTIYPAYNENKKSGSISDMFLQGDYHTPLSRNEINQSDCYYVQNKKNYHLRDIVMLIGYGFLMKAKNEFYKITNNIKLKDKKIIENIFNYLGD